jgi:hypothetical protein
LKRRVRSTTGCAEAPPRRSTGAFAPWQYELNEVAGCHGPFCGPEAPRPRWARQAGL